MHVPENGGIGFAGRRENCCAPPYQTIEFSLKAKERNSGAIIFYSSWTVQVTFASRRCNAVAKSGDSGGAGAAQVGRNRTAQASPPAATARPRQCQRRTGGDETPDRSTDNRKRPPSPSASRVATRSRFARSRIWSKDDQRVRQPGDERWPASQHHVSGNRDGLVGKPCSAAGLDDRANVAHAFGSRRTGRPRSRKPTTGSGWPITRTRLVRKRRWR